MGLAGFVVKSQIIWDKVTHGMGDLRGDFAPQHENIIFGTKGRFQFPGARPKSVYQCPRVAPCNLVHPNEKPVQLIQDLIEAITVPGATVLDPFSGSGSTGVAAIKTGRRFLGIELSREYFDISSERLRVAAAETAATVAV
jgi:adenine-specific DNA-methyltransferase